MTHDHDVYECEGCAKVARSAILHAAGMMESTARPIMEKYGTDEELRSLDTTLRILRAHAQSYMDPYTD